MKNFEESNIDERDFENINENLSEIDKERIKKRLKVQILKSQKYNRIIKSIVASIAFLNVVGITSTPVIASRIPFIETIYKNLGFYDKYLDYTQYIGESVEENGIKLTVDNIVGTKHKIIVSIKIESEEKLSDEFRQGLFITSSMGGSSWNSSLLKNSNPNENTIISVMEHSNYEGYLRRGDLEINIRSGNFIDSKLRFPVDFSKSFDNTIERKLNKTVESLDGKVTNIESNIIGTTITIKNNENYYEDNYGVIGGLLLKVDERIFVANSSQIKDNELRVDFPGATYDVVDKAKDISIIPIKTDLNIEEVLDIENVSKISSTELGITYDKSIEFNDGTIGQVYNVEREEDVVRIYYKGETEKHSLLLATEMGLWWSENEGEYTVYNGSFYKDKNEELGYVAEFKDVDKVDSIFTEISDSISLVNRYEISTEIGL